MRRSVFAVVLCFASISLPALAQDALQLKRASDPESTGAVHEQYREYAIDGVMQPDGIHVTIAHSDGAALFESRFVDKQNGKYLEWEFRGEPRYSMSRHVEPGTARTIKEMVTMSKNIVRAIMRGRVNPDRATWTKPRDEQGGKTIRPEDNYGCDWPFDALSCTTAGHCCDDHDACFETFNCDALSWLGLESVFCAACDLALVGCITSSTGDATGLPSYCCYQGNCGQPRQPIYFGDFGGDGHHDDLQQIEPSGGGGGGGGGTGSA